MGWKTRGNHEYYYKTRRVNGKHITEYIGGGSVGRLAAELEALDVIDRKEQRQAEREEKRYLARTIKAESTLVAQYCRIIECVFVGEMTNRGYHRHARGPWRKRHMNAIAMETTYESTPALADTLTKEEMEAVVMAAAEAEGGSQARREFRQLLNSKWREDVIAWCSISYRPIVRGLILSISAKSGEDGPDAIKLATEARMADLIKNLTPPDACALEKLLVERVAVTHLSLLVSEFRSANMLDDLATTEMRSRQVDRAQNRFFQAVRALASFRKVDPPALMLNVQAIGQQAIVTNPSPESRTRNVGCH